MRAAGRSAGLRHRRPPRLADFWIFQDSVNNRAESEIA
jgi:hypothetical protein